MRCEAPVLSAADTFSAGNRQQVRIRVTRRRSIQRAGVGMSDAAERHFQKRDRPAGFVAVAAAKSGSRAGRTPSSGCRSDISAAIAFSQVLGEMIFASPACFATPRLCSMVLGPGGALHGVRPDVETGRRKK